MAESKKMLILNLIYKYRDILFGKFSSTLTHEIKAAKWKEIAEELKASGVYSKDWRYLRDTTWQNWRKRTMEKKDNRRQTGSGGGKKFKYDESDELIINIIGKDSPAIGGMNIPESSGSQETQVATSSEAESTSTSGPPTAVLDTSFINNINASTSGPLNTELDTSMKNNATANTHGPRNEGLDISITNNGCGRNKSFNKNRARLVSSVEYDDELCTLKKQKLEAEIKLTKEKTEIAKRERYKLDLELLKLEKELQITQPSSYTMPYILQNNTVIVLQEEIQENHSVDILQEAVNSIKEN